MKGPTPTAETVFADLVALPAGKAREDFLNERCADNPVLRSELESLLQAYDEPGNFLETGDTEGVSEASARQGPASPVPLPAAAYAAAFLTSGQPKSAMDAFVESVPGDLRKEVRERIAAGLRIHACSTTVTRNPAPLPEPNPVLPGYRIEHKIGEGSLGVVYRAQDTKLNRTVAVKVLRASNSVGRRLLKEARQAAALSDPAVVTIYAVLDEIYPPAIVMEFVEGFPLDRFAERLSFEQKARLLREVARGLATAHAQGLVHRDLKPDNIVVGPEMRPRILDFGLALSLDEAGLQGRGFEGTPLYASPEQVRAAPLTTASDIFSFGSLMFKVLTGRAPFLGETIEDVLRAIATTPPPMLRDVAVGVPEDLQAICLACLAWDPADRPSAPELVAELGRFLIGEPVRVRPKLYDDLLRRSISQQADQARHWESQSIISREERDALAVVHRRLLADEDHWIVDARKITLPQTVLSAGTWLTVVATVLTVWMLRDDVGPFWRWALPSIFTLTLLVMGYAAHRVRDALATATFLAGAALAIAPCTLSWFGELGVFATAPRAVTQLFDGTFTNQQVFVASLTALLISLLSLWRMKMTGFAWTTAVLGAASHVSLLLLFNWLERPAEIQALWCLPLIALEPIALVLERKGRVRWTLPFHLIALVALVVGLDVMAWHGPTLEMLGLAGLKWAYLDSDRLQAFSFALNGLLFLLLMLVTERSPSLDLRRASRLMEILAILHTLTALFVNAINHRDTAHVRVDVWLYLAAALLFVAVAPLRSRWRILIGGLAGCGLGSYLLVDLNLVARQPFIVSLGFAGLLVALSAFAYLRRPQRLRSWHQPANQHPDGADG